MQQSKLLVAVFPASTTYGLPESYVLDQTPHRVRHHVPILIAVIWTVSIHGRKLEAMLFNTSNELVTR
jgi:hypothetical protein